MNHDPAIHALTERQRNLAERAEYLAERAEELGTFRAQVLAEQERVNADLADLALTIALLGRNNEHGTIRTEGEA